jgi:galactokinase
MRAVERMPQRVGATTEILTGRVAAEERSFWAPGRVNLIGEYTDLAGGLVLPAAIDLGVRVDAVPSERISLQSDGYEEPAELAADGTELEGAGWGRYVAAVAVELALLGRPPVGLEGRLRSSLPVGAGLSSSAALEVAVAVALCAVADFSVEPMALAQAARRSELRAVGVPSGIMDQAASLLGRAGNAILLDTGSLQHELVQLPPELALLIVDSGVSRSLESSAYTTRQRELEQALNAHGGLDETLARRLRHVETENERVREVVAALRGGRLGDLGELFRAGHESLRRDLEVTIPELDRLVDLAYAHGAIAARMTGGGFGGSIVALARADKARELGESIVRDYGGQGRAYVCAASDGAAEVA